MIVRKALHAQTIYFKEIKGYEVIECTCDKTNKIHGNFFMYIQFITMIEVIAASCVRPCFKLYKCKRLTLIFQISNYLY